MNLHTKSCAKFIKLMVSSTYINSIFKHYKLDLDLETVQGGKRLYKKML